MSKHFTVNSLPKNDPRFLKWKESLKKRPPSWSKGFTKETHPGVRKISTTFREKGINNFFNWREKMKENGEVAESLPFIKNQDLATLIGLVLGDGHIEVFPRCERLTITLGTDKPKLITFTAELVKRVFQKKPNVRKASYANCVKVDLYQKLISERLEIISGKRRYDTLGIPSWIWKNEKFLIACLRGLYEAEASLCIHLPTYTYNFAFNNRNEKLLSDVKRALIQLGLHPEERSVAIRIRRKNEVKYLSDLLSFRRY